MKNKIILEQEPTGKPPVTTTTIDLGQAYKSGCFTIYKWFIIDPAPQPKKTKTGQSVISGKNNKGEQIFFYENGTVKNVITQKQLNWSCSNVSTESNSILSNFGITKNDKEKVKQFTPILQGYINKGAVSDVFTPWNNMLSVNFPDVTKLIKIKDVSFDLPLNLADLESKYKPIPGLDKTYNWNNVKIYLPYKETENLTTPGKVNLTVADCQTKLKEYFISAIQTNAGITQAMDSTQSLKYQNDIRRCWANNAYKDFKGITKDDISNLTSQLTPFGFFERNLSYNNIKKIFKGGTKYLTPRNAFPYIFDIEERIKKESTIDNLDSLIKENLIMSLNEKKKSVLTENTILKNRTEILLEGGIPTTKEGQEKLIDEIINEAISLNSQGYTQELINENFWDAIKGLFGSHIGGGVVEMFKEKFMRYLIGKLTPIDPDGWGAGIVEKAFGNIPVSDYFNGKILECDYLTHVIAKSLVEEVVAKAGQKMGAENAIFDVLRNSIVNQLDDTDFAKNIEHGLSKIVCPAIQGISGKMSAAVDKMKDKALAA